MERGDKQAADDVASEHESLRYRHAHPSPNVCPAALATARLATQPLQPSQDREADRRPLRPVQAGRMLPLARTTEGARSLARTAGTRWRALSITTFTVAPRHWDPLHPDARHPPRLEAALAPRPMMPTTPQAPTVPTVHATSPAIAMYGAAALATSATAPTASFAHFGKPHMPLRSNSLMGSNTYM